MKVVALLLLGALVRPLTRCACVSNQTLSCSGGLDPGSGVPMRRKSSRAPPAIMRARHTTPTLNPRPAWPAPLRRRHARHRGLTRPPALTWPSSSRPHGTHRNRCAPHCRRRHSSAPALPLLRQALAPTAPARRPSPSTASSPPRAPLLLPPTAPPLPPTAHAHSMRPAHTRPPPSRPPSLPQMPVFYQPVDQLYCVRAVYRPINPSDLSQGIRVQNTARAGGVTGRPVGSSSGAGGFDSIVALPARGAGPAAASKLSVGPGFLLHLARAGLR